MDVRSLRQTVIDEPIARTALMVICMGVIGMVFGALIPGFFILLIYLTSIFLCTGEPMPKCIIASASVFVVSLIFYAFNITPNFEPTFVTLILFFFSGFAASFFSLSIKQSADMSKSEVVYLKREVKRLKGDQTVLQKQSTTSKEELVKTEMRLKDRTMKVTQVLSKVKSLGGHIDYQSILDNLTEILIKDAQAIKFGIFLFDEANKELFSVKIYGYEKGDKALDSARDNTIIVPVDSTSLLSVCVETGNVIELEDVKRTPQLLGLLSKGVVKTVYAGPLKAADKIVGAINIEKAGKKGIGKFERTLLDTVCTLAGLTMSNARLFDQTRKNLENVKALSAKQRQKNLEIKDLFGKYVSKNLVNQLLSSDDDIALGGGREHVVALFSDIRGFTTLCEGNSPEAIVELLNEYFSEMTEAIFRYDGTLDKFIGDAIMALFGVPVKFKNPHLKAVLTALEMQARLKKLQKIWAKAGKLNIEMGIGINCGPAIVGNIGSIDRMDYTAIGDTINLAARLEENAKPGEILVSESLFLKIRDCVVVEPRGTIQVKGKKQLVKTFNVTGVKKSALELLNRNKVAVSQRPGISQLV